MITVILNPLTNFEDKENYIPFVPINLNYGYYITRRFLRLKKRP